MSFYIIYFIVITLVSIIYTLIEINTNKYLIERKRTHSDKMMKSYIIIFIHAIFYFTMMYTLFMIILIYKVPKRFIIGYIIYLILLIIHWKTNNDQCFITNLLNTELELPNNLGFRGIEHVIKDVYPRVSSDDVPIPEEDVENYYYSVYFFIIYSVFLYFIKS